MWLRKWDDLPMFMKNDEVKRYYDILKRKKISLVMKRIFDIIMSFFMLLLLSPIFLVLSIWIKLDSKGPVFYRQERVTQYGKLFKIFKFRTMVSNADQIGSLVTTQNDSRITKVGEKIRKCRLDEIPQLINVLKGEMSFVGTRPEVQKYVAAYTKVMNVTLLLPAGITSLASIKFKDEDEIISKYVNDEMTIDQVYIQKVLPEKMKFNLEYLCNFNFTMDIKTCIHTII